MLTVPVRESLTEEVAALGSEACQDPKLSYSGRGSSLVRKEEIVGDQKFRPRFLVQFILQKRNTEVFWQEIFMMRF